MPTELAAGPEVTRWALPQYVAEWEAAQGADRVAAVRQAKASAGRRWRVAVWEWADSHGVPRQIARRMTSRRVPYV